MLIIHFGIHVGVDIRVDRETNGWTDGLRLSHFLASIGFHFLE